MNIREHTTSLELREEVRNIMIQFWEAYDKLITDMDNLTESEFHIRNQHMWGFVGKATEYGEYFLISLYGMDEKAERLYGSASSFRQDVFSRNGKLN